jgi:hypothetical protein
MASPAQFTFRAFHHLVTEADFNACDADENDDGSTAPVLAVALDTAELRAAVASEVRDMQAMAADIARDEDDDRRVMLEAIAAGVLSFEPKRAVLTITVPVPPASRAPPSGAAVGIMTRAAARAAACGESAPRAAAPSSADAERATFEFWDDLFTSEVEGAFDGPYDGIEGYVGKWNVEDIEEEEDW